MPGTLTSTQARWPLPVVMAAAAQAGGDAVPSRGLELSPRRRGSPCGHLVAGARSVSCVHLRKTRALQLPRGRTFYTSGERVSESLEMLHIVFKLKIQVTELFSY